MGVGIAIDYGSVVEVDTLGVVVGAGILLGCRAAVARLEQVGAGKRSYLRSVGQQSCIEESRFVVFELAELLLFQNCFFLMS